MSRPADPNAPVPEFSRTIQADRIAAGGAVQEIEATEAERQALARRFEIPAIERLGATLQLRRVRDGAMIRVEGTVHADVVQTCVVTLEPVRGHVEEAFTELFAPPEMAPEDTLDVEIDPEAEDLPVAIENGRIDLGELAAQHLSLALDPYPRSPGATFGDDGAGEGAGAAEESERMNPFAPLAKLKP